MYKAHMCMYMLGGRMRSWTNCFFLKKIFFRKRKPKPDIKNRAVSKMESANVHCPDH